MLYKGLIPIFLFETTADHSLLRSAGYYDDVCEEASENEITLDTKGFDGEVQGLLKAILKLGGRANGYIVRLNGWEVEANMQMLDFNYMTDDLEDLLVRAFER